MFPLSVHFKRSFCGSGIALLDTRHGPKGFVLSRCINELRYTDSQVTHQNSWRNSIARQPSGACGMRPIHDMRNTQFYLLIPEDGHVHHLHRYIQGRSPEHPPPRRSSLPFQ